MRKLFCVILSILLLGTYAFAAANSYNLKPDEENGGSIQNAAVCGDMVYGCGYDCIYTWQVGDEKLTHYELESETSDEHSRIDPQRVFAWNDSPYVLRASFYSGSDEYRATGLDVAKVVLNNGKAQVEKAIAVNIEDLIYSEGKNTYLCQINDVLCVGDKLCMNIFDGNGAQSIYIIDLTSGEGAFAPLNDVEGMTPYAENQILTVHYDYTESTIGFDIYDIEAESVSQWCEPIDYNVCDARNGLAYDPTNQRLYFLNGGYLKMVENCDFENIQTISELSTEYNNANAAQLLSGKYYVCCNYDGVYIRELNPEHPVEAYLEVLDNSYCSSVHSTQNAFNHEHEAVSAIVSRDYMEDSRIIEKMMTHDAKPDIYILNTGSKAFAALSERGFMLELSGNEAVRSFVEGMYPALRNACMRDGEIIGVPVSIVGWTMSANVNKLEQLGISRDRIPNNWPDFLDFLNELPDLLPEDGSTAIFERSMTVGDMRFMLLNTIMGDYYLYLTANGMERGYATPELTTILEKLLHVDFEKMGLRSDEETDDDGSAHYVMTDRETVLFQPSDGCAIGNFAYRGEPLLLSISPDTQAYLPIEMSAAFINPYSENREAAIEFIEQLVKNGETSLLYNINDQLNDPKRYSGYDDIIVEWQNNIQSLRDSLKSADPIEVPRIEEEIASYESGLEEFEQNGWEISPQSIEWYRANADKLLVQGYNYIYGDQGREIYDLYQQFTAEKIDAATMLKGIDQKVKMMIMEGN